MAREESPLMTDAVEKLSDTQRAGNNRIQFLHFFESVARQPRILNQCCSLAPRKAFFDSIEQKPTLGMRCRNPG
jgi:hypothetical protein